MKIDRAERVLGLALTLLLVAFHLVWLRSAGGFWRDEVVSVTVATKPTLSQLWAAVRYDSFPALLHLLLHAWLRLGASEASIRLFGLCLGLAMLGGLWLASRMLGSRAPLACLALFACNPVTVQWVNSIRAYGLGALLALLSVGALWRVVDAPTAGRVALAAGLSVLSVQALYNNAFLLLAACTAAAIVALSHRSWRRCGLVVGIGATAALSLVPYATTLGALREFQQMLPHGLTPLQIAGRLAAALGAPGRAAIAVWILLSAVGLAAAATTLARRRSDLHLYATAVLALGTTTGLVYLKLVDLPTQAWYYLPLMALAALCLDAIFGASGPRLRALRAAACALLVVVAWLPTWRAIQVRQTNVDLIAAELARAAAPEDMILVYPWYCGATFAHYYGGRTPWTTLPPHADLPLQRFDLLREQMTARDPVGPVLQRLAATLQSGHRVWLVGGLPEGPAPALLPPAPLPGSGWNKDPYVEGWALQASQLLRSRALRGRPWPVPVQGPINPFEDLDLLVVEGWRER